MSEQTPTTPAQYPRRPTPGSRFEQVRVLRDQRNQASRQAVEAAQQGIAEFQCSGGDCCDALWARVMALVEAVTGTEDDIERNRLINTQYAKLYLSNPQAQVWAGTAAFVSKQAGCEMRSLPRNIGAPLGPLGDINRGIFGSIYGPLRMVEEGRGRMSPERLKQCVEGKMDAMFVAQHGADADDEEVQYFRSLKRGVVQTVDGQGEPAAIAIADYEQHSVAQPHWEFSNSPRLWAGGVVSNNFGVARELYLTNTCSGSPAQTVYFDGGPGRPTPRDVTAARDRVNFYTDDYLPEFMRRAQEPGGFEASMRQIRDRNP
jgi:hypothetical protein